MKKLISIATLLIFTSISFANSIIVEDITKGGMIVFTPGVNYFAGQHGCKYNWGGNKAYKFNEFMDGVTSYEYDIKLTPDGSRCFNIKTDVSNVIVNVPYVNVGAFKNSANPPQTNSARVVTASTETIGSIFTVEDNIFELGVTNISVGRFGSPNYFVCEVNTNSLMHRWLLLAGIDDIITPGYVLSITWFGGHKTCAGISMVFDPALLYPPLIVNPPVPIPPQCPANCIK